MRKSGLCLVWYWCMCWIATVAAAQEPAHADRNDTQNPQRPLRLLFIGNSLTYGHDLPQLVAALAQAGGFARPELKVMAVPNYGLGDHWYRARARSTIKQGKWDFVVLQQGPSASAEGRSLLLRDTARFSRLSLEHGAKPALYMVWPALDRREDFARSCESYRLAAEQNQALLLPAGTAWRRALENRIEADLYARDRFHPSPAGSMLAALVIYQRLYGLDANQLRAQMRASIETAQMPEANKRTTLALVEAAVSADHTCASK